MTLLLDTNVLSELRRGERCHPQVRLWAASVDEEDVHTSVMVLGELRLGIERVRRRDAWFAAQLEQWLARVVACLQGRIHPVDREVALAWGRIGAARTVPPIDGLLAATAFVHGLTIVTRNVADFADLGVSCLNAFEPSS